MSTLIITTGITRSHGRVDDAGAPHLTIEAGGVTVDLTGATPYQLDQLATEASKARDEHVEQLPDECRCNGGDLPLFDHARLCPLRVRARFAEEVVADA